MSQFATKRPKPRQFQVANSPFPKNISYYSITLPVTASVMPATWVEIQLGVNTHMHYEIRQNIRGACASDGVKAGKKYQPRPGTMPENIV
jgi:hypothetical protein